MEREGVLGETPTDGPLMGVAEVAQLLGVPVSGVYEQLRLGRTPTVTLGQYRREAIGESRYAAVVQRRGEPRAVSVGFRRVE